MDWSVTLYPRRWAIENLFKQIDKSFGRSESQDLFPRQFHYTLACHVIAAYSLWRIVDVKHTQRSFHDLHLRLGDYLVRLREKVRFH